MVQILKTAELTSRRPNFGTEPYPTSGNRKWASSVEAFLPIINWQTITEDGHLEMLNHGVHHLSGTTTKILLPSNA